MKDVVILLAVGAAVVFGIRSFVDSEWYQESVRERKALEHREQTPHVVREADGCKVYAFKSGDRYHYFTRCPDSTATTESSYSVGCGKGCSRTETESITTR